MKKVLLIGKSANVLERLSSSLKADGFAVEVTTLYKNIPHLLLEYKGSDFDVVAFGRAVSQADKLKIETAFVKENTQIAFVSGLAPIIDLLLEQIKLAINKPDPDVEISWSPHDHILSIASTQQHYLAVKYYHLNWFYRKTTKILLEQQVKSGNFEMQGLKRKGRGFLVVYLNGNVSEIITT